MSPAAASARAGSTGDRLVSGTSRLLGDPVVWAIALAWGAAIALHGAGLPHAPPHEHHGTPGHAAWPGVAAFLLVWHLHVVAIMLPSSLPMIGLFGRVAAGQDRPRLARASFLSGYIAVWTIFGVAAFGGQVALGHVVQAIPLLNARPGLLTGVILAGAGAFQFTDLKDRCLRMCRLPRSYLRAHYRRGVGAAFRIGTGHGFFCVGCCWALMLAMLALGFANLLWMAPFAALMVAEKAAPWGRRLVVPAGAALLLVGVLVVVRSW